MSKKFDIIDVVEIMQMIPHRYPILLVDRIVNFDNNESIIGLKNVTFNEPYFTGHFPSKPIMPGVLIIESLAQTAAIFVVKTLNITSANKKLVYFMSIENAKFRRQVIPGDTMYLHAVKQQNRGKVWKFHGQAMVNDKIVAEANFMAMIVDNPNE